MPLFAFWETLVWYFQGTWPFGWPWLTMGALAIVAAVGLFLASQGWLLKASGYIGKLPALAWANARSAAESFKKENQGTFIHTDHKM
jgi:hypothetical protein